MVNQVAIRIPCNCLNRPIRPSKYNGEEVPKSYKLLYVSLTSQYITQTCFRTHAPSQALATTIVGNNEGASTYSPTMRHRRGRHVVPCPFP